MSGAEGMLVPALIAGAGTAANYYGEKQAANERRGILNNAFAKVNDTTDKATKLVTDEGAKLAGDQRLQAMQGQEAAAYNQAQQDLTKTGAAGGIDTVGDGGNVSGDFMKAKADRALAEGNRMTAIARELARTRSPSLMLQDEGLRRADIAGQTNSMFGSTRNLTNAAQLDAQGVDSPWWGKMGKLAQMAALAYATGGGAAGGGASAGLAM